MRRRKIDLLTDDLKESLKSEAKGFFGTIIKLFLSKIVEIVIQALLKKQWVDVTDDWDINA